MALLNESTSLVVSLVLSVVTFSGMQMAKAVLSSTPAFTILGGFLVHTLVTTILTQIYLNMYWILGLYSQSLLSKVGTTVTESTHIIL